MTGMCWYKANTKTCFFFFPIAKYLSSKHQRTDSILQRPLGSNAHFLIKQKAQQFAKGFERLGTGVCVLLSRSPTVPRDISWKGAGHVPLADVVVDEEDLKTFAQLQMRQITVWNTFTPIKQCESWQRRLLTFITAHR